MRERFLGCVLCALAVLGALGAGTPASAEAPVSEDEFTAIFNGKNLDGWHALPGGVWEAREGMIVGTSEKSEERHGLLLTDKTYKDFIARVEFRVLEGDSGCYFRAEETGDRVGVAGFQVEVDSSLETGGLYETSGRRWVIKPDPEVNKDIYTPGEWTRLQVTAIGTHVEVLINGKKTAELKNDTKGRRSGKIALQLHGGMDMHVEFKNLRIHEIASEDISAPEAEK